MIASRRRRLASRSMLDSYRRVLSRPGALALLRRPALVARLPISMVGLGIVLLVAAARPAPTALAGAVSAAYVLAKAAFAILQGRLVDQLRPGAGAAARDLGLRRRGSR